MKHPHTLIRRTLLALLASGLFGAVAPGQAAGLCYDPISHGMVSCPGASPVPAQIVQDVVNNVTQQVINQAPPASPPTPTYLPPSPSLTSSCTQPASYYQERYASCMSTDSRGAAYCVEWSGCPSKVSQ